MLTYLFDYLSLPAIRYEVFQEIKNSTAVLFFCQVVTDFSW